MLRITELKLPLDHAPDALALAVAARLRIAPAELTSVHVAKRSVDARKKQAIVLIYTVDCEIAGDEAALLEVHAADRHVQRAPDVRYRHVAHAPADYAAHGEPRPVVIGFGP